MMRNQEYTQEVVNLHTHSFYCGHGSGTVEEYVQSASEKGIALLGMSEHCPVPDGRWNRSRMDFDQIESYERDCRVAKETAPEGLSVLTGYECDYLPEYQSYYAEVAERVDYLICAIHDLSTELSREYSVFWNQLSKKNLATYTDMYCESLSSGLFLFGAHPDLFGYYYHTWDGETEACSRAIIECAVANNVALEINANGMRKRKVQLHDGWRNPYPLSPFWEIASEYPLQVVTNSDAHNPSLLKEGYEACAQIASENNLQFCSYRVEREQTGSTRIVLV
ncbi:histidinol-phosphatase [Sphaerochaeta halotolerans]|jgi:histidinol-phosphatase (PHP family)|uniref:histidinol-phosphatase n=1 Tax=Sphaerochaeta halotolerans TaxID=2293840 RepID=UPI001F3116BB|nr:histidinol-phosphatase [Sphaerochaeta halotolerans]MDN5334415.1 histidinol-phosphatase family [Sphaerochaeta sp.]